MVQNEHNKWESFANLTLSYCYSNGDIKEKKKHLKTAQLHFLDLGLISRWDIFMSKSYSLLENLY